MLAKKRGLLFEALSAEKAVDLVGGPQRRVGRTELGGGTRRRVRFAAKKALDQNGAVKTGTGAQEIEHVVGCPRQRIRRQRIRRQRWGCRRRRYHDGAGRRRRRRR